MGNGGLVGKEELVVGNIAFVSNGVVGTEGVVVEAGGVVGTGVDLDFSDFFANKKPPTAKGIKVEITIIIIVRMLNIL